MVRYLVQSAPFLKIRQWGGLAVRFITVRASGKRRDSARFLGIGIGDGNRLFFVSEVTDHTFRKYIEGSAQ